MVHISNKEFVIDGEPKLILAGQIDYFRLEKKDWQNRLTMLKEAGFNAVASYIPWLCHEEKEGEFDLDGHTREELDLAGFLELCKENDLYLIARPGPFVMSEMINEGIPNWVIEKYPELRPRTWDNRECQNATLDYLAPEFLECVKKWYAQVIPLLSRYIQPNGGNIIGLQLDNEIGMLSWCGNAPDLTDFLLKEFRVWLETRYTWNGLKERYLLADDSQDGFAAAVRSPKEAYVLELHKDLGYYMRKRTADYVRVLTDYAKEYGFHDVPYMINIHGTADNRGLKYPIGISQLYEAYTMSDEYLAGSDIYLGNLEMNNFQDLYILNAYMEAVNRENQPLASFEFQCGDGNYGETHGGRIDVSAVDLKTRMCVAQGNKVINFYRFCGGYNYRMDPEMKDGNGRIAYNGQRHGFAAPVSPEGELNYTYPRMAEVLHRMETSAEKLAVMQEERDTVALGFIPDYYMTEFHYPASERETEFWKEVNRFRGGDGFDRMGRSMLLNNYRFTAVDIQNREPDEEKVKTLVIFSATYMAAEIQTKLVEYMKCGGSVLLYGRMPVRDMEGNSCTILQDAVGVRTTGYFESGFSDNLSVLPAGMLEGCPEVRASFVETYQGEGLDVIMKKVDTSDCCGFIKEVGKGRVMMLGTPYICHLPNIRRMLETLGSTPALEHTEKYHGLFMTVSTNGEEKYLHILNLDGFEKHAVISYHGKELFDGKEIRIGSRRGMMLPLDMKVGEIKVLYATAEIAEIDREAVTFALTQREDVICIEGCGKVKEGPDYIVEEKDGKTFVRSTKSVYDKETIRVQLQ